MAKIINPDNLLMNFEVPEPTIEMPKAKQVKVVSFRTVLPKIFNQKINR